MNTEDPAKVRFINDAESIGVSAVDATALFQRLGVAATAAKTAAENDGRTTTSPIADLALRRMSRQLATSMTKLVDEFNQLLDQLAGAEAAHLQSNQGDNPIMAEAEQIRQQLVCGGYRLASELRKVALAQQKLCPGSAQPTPISRNKATNGKHSAAVIDIQDVLKTIRGKLQEVR